MSILNSRIEKKFKRRRAIKRWWFKLTKLRFMRKRIRKVLYKEQVKEDLAIYKIGIYASDFKKLSRDQIDYGLKMFVEREELISFEFRPGNDVSKDEYILVLPVENLSHERFLERILKEINLNDVKLEQLAENTSAERDSDPTEQTSTEQTKQSSESIEPKQEQTTTPQSEDNKPF